MKRRSILLIVALAVLGGVAFGLKEYFRGHNDVGGMDAVHAVDAPALLAEFMADDAAARAKYVGSSEQAIQVSGVIAAIEAGSGTSPANVRLETGDPMASVACEFAPTVLPAGWKAGDHVSVKGICQGYTGDGMLPGDVVLQRCIDAEQ